MKTFLLIEESGGSIADPLYIEDKSIQMLPCIGDLITLFKSPKKRGSDAPDWSQKGIYKVVSRSYEIYDMAGTEKELTCTLTVARQP